MLIWFARLFHSVRDQFCTKLLVNLTRLNGWLCIDKSFNRRFWHSSCEQDKLPNSLFTLIWFARLFHSVRDQFCTETVGELDLPENCSHDSWISTNSVFPLSSFSSVSGKVLNSLRKWVHGSLKQCGRSQSEVTLDLMSLCSATFGSGKKSCLWNYVQNVWLILDFWKPQQPCMLICSLLRGC